MKTGREIRSIGARVLGFLLLVGIVNTAGTADAAQLHVVTTTQDLAAIARAVGGDAVEVRSIARGYWDPHYVEAKPSYMRHLNRADLLIYNGLELEIGWLPLLIQGSRNRRVMPGSAGSLDASRELPILEIPVGEVNRSMGDIHPEGNPHYTLDPRNGKPIAAAIRERFKRLAPEQGQTFEANCDTFQLRLSKRMEVWERTARSLRGRKIVAFHKQWEYLADWLGLEIVDYVEVKPGIPPSPRHISRLEELIEREKITLLLRANFGDTRAAEKVAERAGIQLLTLPASVDGEEGIVSYEDLFEALVTRIVSGGG